MYNDAMISYQKTLKLKTLRGVYTFTGFSLYFGTF